MKHIKLFENFESGSESDLFIADTLKNLDIPYTVGKDESGNDGVFLTDEVEGSGYPVKFEIYSTHPDKEHSAYNVTYYTRDNSDSFKTTNLETSLQDILDLE